MKLPISLMGLLAVVAACGGDFSSGGGGAAGSAPDASAGSSGAGGDTGSASTTSGGGDDASGSSAGGSTGTGGRTGSSGPGPGVGGRVGAGGVAGTAGSGGAGGSSRDSGRDAPSDVGTADGGVACKIDSDCKLVDDCCLGCVAKGTDFPVPPCSQQCLVDPCGGAGVKGVRCFQGTCSLAAECDPRGVACDSLPPPCPAGEVPSVSGSCWSGKCVKASLCRTVKDCAVCDAPGLLCGQTQTQIGNEFRCVDVPAACANDRSCTCAGPYVCMPPFGTCSTPTANHFLCSCPNC